jgi:predicted dehydrogenase
VDAVDIVLPIEQLAAAVDMALAAGKHIISEKPITPTVEEGKKLLSVYSHHQSQVWMVAENWRYESAFVRAATAIEQIGRPYLCHWALHLGVLPGAKYYITEWRRSGTFPGGFLMDGGVHHVAAMRLVVGEISHVSALAAQMRPDLPPSDTLTASLQFDFGLLGSYSVTYANTAPFPSHLTIIGENGALQVNRDFLEVTVDGQKEALPLAPSQGVTDELAAFANAVREGASHRNSPGQALQDVAVVEAMLGSAKTGMRVKVERFV